MEQARQLQARLESLGELRHLIRAMRALAASHLQEAQDALEGVGRYSRIVATAVAEAVLLCRQNELDSLPAAEGSPPGDDKPGLLLLFGCEQGFVGGLNDRLLDRLSEPGPGGLAGRRLAVVGRRGAALAAERGLPLVWSQPMAPHAKGVPQTTRQLARLLRGETRIDCLHPLHRTGGLPEISLERLLPLDPARFEQDGLGKEASIREPFHYLAPDVLLEHLGREYLLAELARVAMQSLAGENAARLHAMSFADRNIGDRLETLGQQARIQRQEAITTELLDVITGAEAILEGDASADAS